MKAQISMELRDEELNDLVESNDTTWAEAEEELIQMLYEICEDWVLRGQVPDIEIITTKRGIEKNDTKESIKDKDF